MACKHFLYDFIFQTIPGWFKYCLVGTNSWQFRSNNYFCKMPILGQMFFSGKWPFRSKDIFGQLIAVVKLSFRCNNVPRLRTYDFLSTSSLKDLSNFRSHNTKMFSRPAYFQRLEWKLSSFTYKCSPTHFPLVRLLMLIVPLARLKLSPTLFVSFKTTAATLSHRTFNFKIKKSLSKKFVEK